MTPASSYRSHDDRTLVSLAQSGDREAADQLLRRHYDLAVVDQLVVQEALARLPDDFRIAVVLRDVADLDYADIADTLGVPIGTVRSRIARGRALLVRELSTPDADGNQTDDPERPTQ